MVLVLALTSVSSPFLKTQSLSIVFFIHAFTINIQCTHQNVHPTNLRNHVLLRRRLASLPRRNLSQRTGQSHHPLLRGLHPRGSRILPTRRRRRQEPGLAKPRQHRLRRQTSHRTTVHRRHRPIRQEAAAVSNRAQRPGQTGREGGGRKGSREEL